MILISAGDTMKLWKREETIWEPEKGIRAFEERI